MHSVRTVPHRYLTGQARRPASLNTCGQQRCTDSSKTSSSISFKLANPAAASSCFRKFSTQQLFLSLFPALQMWNTQLQIDKQKKKTADSVMRTLINSRNAFFSRSSLFVNFYQPASHLAGVRPPRLLLRHYPKEEEEDLLRPFACFNPCCPINGFDWSRSLHRCGRQMLHRRLFLLHDVGVP